jgi:dTMP kinase
MAYFITFEGIEGSGKTTQMEMAQRFLCSQGYKVKVTREPGGTTLGEQIRGVLLSTVSTKIDPCAELLLYQASRAQIVQEIILPALGEGFSVLCDRFTDATLAYQGYGRGLDLDLIRRLNDSVTGGLRPDLTFLLDCPTELGIERIRLRSQDSGGGRGLDRLEQEGIAFHEQVRQGYLAVARDEQARIVVIDAREDVETVHARIKEHIVKKLEKT